MTPMPGLPFAAGPWLAALAPVEGESGLFGALIQTLLFAAASFALVCALVSHMRYRRILQEARAQLKVGAGLDAFTLAVSERIGFMGRNTKPFGMLLMRHQAVGDPSPGLTEAARGAVASQLRAGDELILLADGRIGLIVDTQREHLAPIAERIREGLRRTVWQGENVAPQRLGMAIAMASHPENGHTADALLAAVEESLPRALEGAGWALAHAEAPPAGEATADAAASDETHLLDELTGVLKPARVGSALQKFVARFRRDESPVTIVLCDVDGLDQYNNHYGRAAGDAILRLTARLLMDHCRETDLIGRTGEDEFVICMPCRPAKALVAARRMTAEIKKATLEHGGNRLRFTACMGLAGFPEHGGSPVQLYDRARIALENAKTRGRCVCEEFERKTAARPHVQGAKVDSF